MNFPATSSSFYSSSRVMITAPVLTNQMAQCTHKLMNFMPTLVLFTVDIHCTCTHTHTHIAVVSVVVNNIQTFLPQQMENNKLVATDWCGLLSSRELSTYLSYCTCMTLCVLD